MNAGAKRRQILIVEDNTSDVFLIREALNAANVDADLQIVNDGENAIRFFDDADRDETRPCVALVILDINLPRKHGAEVLERIRKSKCGDVLVIVVSTSDSARDREQMITLGANRYFRKPSQWDAFLKLGEIVKDMLDSRAPGSSTSADQE